MVGGGVVNKSGEECLRSLCGGRKERRDGFPMRMGTSA
jgi:hypothetical protein